MNQWFARTCWYASIIGGCYACEHPKNHKNTPQFSLSRQKVLQFRRLEPSAVLNQVGEGRVRRTNPRHLAAGGWVWRWWTLR